ncbi:urease accessory protein UreF [Candidatus Erwinia dacicola]|nr:urease accessory UreF family protein [Candidatus Erwinia dacicola]NJD00389.1 urease accessory protein UreF [Candidatus Erwinia dacicola]NJD84891.1 urease accessory protein UreF [Candidatus Erwinia dacicola]OFC61555.1 urease accessory protein UreF [Candidatus Erwinia dacicola]
MMTSLQQMRLLQLSSASLPVGSFTYSQGLEWAVEAGWVTSVGQFREWQINSIEQSLILQDLPLLLRLYHASRRGDLNAFESWSQYLLACRETLELRNEETQRGEAMVRILQGIEMILPEAWYNALLRSQIAGLAWAGSVWKIPAEPLMLSQAWSNLESMVMAGVKLVPFGQTAAQQLLFKLSEYIASRLPAVMKVGDEELGSSLPIVAISSALHETQHTRLFRS